MPFINTVPEDARSKILAKVNYPHPKGCELAAAPLPKNINYGKSLHTVAS